MLGIVKAQDGACFPACGLNQQFQAVRVYRLGFCRLQRPIADYQTGVLKFEASGSMQPGNAVTGKRIKRPKRGDQNGDNSRDAEGSRLL